jgi:hypothetical protein
MVQHVISYSVSFHLTHGMFCKQVVGIFYNILSLVMNLNGG